MEEDTNSSLWISDNPVPSSNALFPTYNCTQEELPLVQNRTEWSLACNITLPEATCRPQEYYSRNYSLIGTLFQSIIFLVGVMGNILVCTVVVKTRSMRTTTNCYLVSLAVADTITLVSSVPQEVLSYHILGDQWVWGSVGCTLMIYLQVRVNLQDLQLQDCFLSSKPLNKLINISSWCDSAKKLWDKMLNFLRLSLNTGQRKQKQMKEFNN